MPKRRFFYDTEFIERPPDSTFGPAIDLVSIGIVSFDGTKEFYGCCLDADFARANDWVRMRVLEKLPPVPGVVLGASGFSCSPPWYTREALRSAVLDFLKPSKEDPVELWAYYGAYDHVALCWLFGAMIDLPPGMPMLTKDVKQLCDDVGNPQLEKQGADEEHDALNDARWTRLTWFKLKALQDSSQNEEVGSTGGTDEDR